MFGLGKRFKKVLTSQKGNVTLTTEATLAFVLVAASVTAIEVGQRADCQHSGGLSNTSAQVWSCADPKSCGNSGTSFSGTTDATKMKKLLSKEMSASCQTLFATIEVNAKDDPKDTGEEGGKDDGDNSTDDAV